VAFGPRVQLDAAPQPVRRGRRQDRGRKLPDLVLVADHVNVVAVILTHGISFMLMTLSPKLTDITLRCDLVMRRLLP
jgi:hypothetical protein